MSRSDSPPDASRSPSPTVRRPVRRHRAVDLGLLLRVMRKAGVQPVAEIAQNRRRVAELCHWIGVQVAEVNGWKSPPAPVRPAPVPKQDLSPRMSETLRRLLAGDSEKQIAGHLGVSPHTVHVYVKAIYRRYEVSSRGELLSRFVQSGAAPANTGVNARVIPPGRPVLDRPVSNSPAA